MQEGGRGEAHIEQRGMVRIPDASQCRVVRTHLGGVDKGRWAGLLALCRLPLALRPGAARAGSRDLPLHRRKPVDQGALIQALQGNQAEQALCLHRSTRGGGGMWGRPAQRSGGSCQHGGWLMFPSGGGRRRGRRAAPRLLPTWPPGTGGVWGRTQQGKGPSWPTRSSTQTSSGVVRWRSSCAGRPGCAQTLAPGRLVSGFAAANC